MKPRVVVLGEKPQGCTWLASLLASGLFEVVAGVPRHSLKNVWWDGEHFAALLRAHGIPVVRRQELADLEYDILWSLMYGFIIEEPLIRKAGVGLNLHEAPMPRFRGCNGYSHAILEGEPTWGTSFHVLSAELDSGELIDQELFPIEPDETVKELYVRTMAVSNLLFQRNLERVARGEFPRLPMETVSEPVRPRSSLVDLKRVNEEVLGSPEALYRHARAFDFLPFEPCAFSHDGRRFFVFVNQAFGRLWHRLPAYRIGEPIHRLCEREDAFLLTGLPRELVVMEAGRYRQHYPVFVPEYSWVKT